jgi:hypothetical protein
VVPVDIKGCSKDPELFHFLAFYLPFLSYILFVEKIRNIQKPISQKSFLDILGFRLGLSNRSIR